MTEIILGDADTEEALTTDANGTVKKKKTRTFLRNLFRKKSKTPTEPTSSYLLKNGGKYNSSREQSSFSSAPNLYYPKKYRAPNPPADKTSPKHQPASSSEDDMSPQSSTAVSPVQNKRSSQMETMTVSISENNQFYSAKSPKSDYSATSGKTDMEVARIMHNKRGLIRRETIDKYNESVAASYPENERRVAEATIDLSPEVSETEVILNVELETGIDHEEFERINIDFNQPLKSSTAAKPHESFDSKSSSRRQSDSKAQFTGLLRRDSSDVSSSMRPPHVERLSNFTLKSTSKLPPIPVTSFDHQQYMSPSSSSGVGDPRSSDEYSSPLYLNLPQEYTLNSTPTESGVLDTEFHYRQISESGGTLNDEYVKLMRMYNEWEALTYDHSNMKQTNCAELQKQLIAQHKIVYDLWEKEWEGRSESTSSGCSASPRPAPASIRSNLSNKKRISILTSPFSTPEKKCSPSFSSKAHSPVYAVEYGPSSIGSMKINIPSLNSLDPSTSKTKQRLISPPLLRKCQTESNNNLLPSISPSQRRSTSKDENSGENSMQKKHRPDNVPNIRTIRAFSCEEVPLPKTTSLEFMQPKRRVSDVKHDFELRHAQAQLENQNAVVANGSQQLTSRRFSQTGNSPEIKQPVSKQRAAPAAPPAANITPNSQPTSKLISHRKAASSTDLTFSPKKLNESPQANVNATIQMFQNRLSTLNANTNPTFKSKFATKPPPYLTVKRSVTLDSTEIMQKSPSRLKTEKPQSPLPLGSAKSKESAVSPTSSTHRLQPTSEVTRYLPTSPPPKGPTLKSPGLIAKMNSTDENQKSRSNSKVTNYSTLESSNVQKQSETKYQSGKTETSEHAFTLRKVEKPVEKCGVVTGKVIEMSLNGHTKSIPQNDGVGKANSAPPPPPPPPVGFLEIISKPTNSVELTRKSPSPGKSPNGTVRLDPEKLRKELQNVALRHVSEDDRTTKLPPINPNPRDRLMEAIRQAGGGKTLKKVPK
ncbi:hypothetical protein DdX_01674 [Ditylenchus destructor]|uniref:WH2 domain-containing protein n=1 Tax=Ditylenchus destructor TaxID=166010 RepID=A0AAD4NM16_9BILA|nr:hypothetical protein DdX_01674 [Ditylenchus destructor]